MAVAAVGVSVVVVVMVIMRVFFSSSSSQQRLPHSFYTQQKYPHIHILICARTQTDNRTHSLTGRILHRFGFIALSVACSAFVVSSLRHLFK